MAGEKELDFDINTYILNNATHVGRNPKLRTYCVNVDSNVYDMFMLMMTAMLTLGITINAG